MPFKCLGGDVEEALKLYLKSKGIWARSINLGIISIRCVLHLQDWINVKNCQERERRKDRRKIQHTRAESGEDRALKAKGRSDQLCCAARRSCKKETDT